MLLRFLTIVILATLTFTGAVCENTYQSNTLEAFKLLNEFWYNENTGLWDESWETSTNAILIVADFADSHPSQAQALNLPNYARILLNKASEDLLTKTGQDFSSFPSFLETTNANKGWWALGMIRSFDITGDFTFLWSAVDAFKSLYNRDDGSCGGLSIGKGYVNSDLEANGLYLLVSASLANRLPQNIVYKEEAVARWKWFLSRSVIDGEALIHSLSPACNPVDRRDWTNIPGIILGGLIELSQAIGDVRYLDFAVDMGLRVIKESERSDGILQEANECDNKPQDCSPEVAQYKGIFMRYLGRLYSKAPYLKFSSFILQNADSIWRNDRDNGGKLGIAWSGPYINATAQSQSSAVDALLAAIKASK